MHIPGKWLLLPLAALALLGGLSVGETVYPDDFDVLRDPRISPEFFEVFRNGERVVAPRTHNSILILDWNPAPDRQINVFQIAGVDGYYKERHVAAFLREFYKLSAEQKETSESPWPLEDLFTAGNNWGSFTGLDPLILELSERYGFSVFRGPGRAFWSADLMKEPPSRQARIEEAFRRATAGEENPALNPQRRLLDALPLLPVALGFEPLEPVPPQTRRTSKRTGNVWFTRPHDTFFGSMVEWSMGWGMHAPSPDDGLSFTVGFSRGRGGSDGDPFGEPVQDPQGFRDPFAEPPVASFDLAEGELSTLDVTGSVRVGSPFLPDSLADRVELEATASRRPNESEENLIARFLARRTAQTSLQPQSTEPRECIGTFETLLRTILRLSRN